MFEVRNEIRLKLRERRRACEKGSLPMYTRRDTIEKLMR